MKTQSVQFYAYHGTLKSSADAIVRDEIFHTNSCRDDHWLGKGAYFFREDYEQALMWAKHKRKNRGDEPSVLEVWIQTNKKYVLNLDSRGGLSILRDFMEYLEKEEKIMLQIGNLEKDSPKIACFIFSLLPEDEIRMIQRTFGVSSKVFDSDTNLQKLNFIHKDSRHNFQLQGTQICVRDPSIINKNSIKIINEIYNR